MAVLPSFGRGPRMPQPCRRLALVGLALRKAHELELHAPRRKEIHPGLACTRTGGAHRGLAENAHSARPEISDGGVDVLHVERQMMAADVAVLGLPRRLIGRVV